ncbi:hypothetical protein CHO01_28750 [Cellulomonas hominis]|uniref:Uncharacterized protein n=1 Tax=Cellulomonas hominis TaxID=156981 RepID=A0A511FET4_9CELL|nr:hypothetical protein [Cellulomonas hominis]MBB5473894.1 hypothetical protein [Cellulomonas hominis]GEL47759.1 hypothetical protein CHO01_28750 [Cellulomonas hominis]
MANGLDAVLATAELGEEERAAIEAAQARFIGVGERQRFARWHDLWPLLDVGARRSVLVALAGQAEFDLLPEEVAALQWRESPGRGVYPDAVLELPGNGEAPGVVWAVLEYKLRASLNGPMLSSVLGAPDDGTLLQSAGPELRAAAYRWHPGGPLRVPQLVAYYAARDRLFGGRTDARTRWLLLTPRGWRAGWDGRWSVPAHAWTCGERDVIVEIPSIWRRRPLEDVVVVLLDLLRSSSLTSGTGSQLVEAIGAVLAAPGTWRWRGRTRSGGEVAFRTLADVVGGGCGLWDGCVTAVWRTGPDGSSASAEVRLEEGTGYIIVPRDAHGVVDADDKELLVEALTGAGQRLPGTGCARHPGRGNCGCVDVDGFDLTCLRERRARDPEQRCLMLT